MNDGRRGLDKKNQMYSILLAAVLLACLVGYFICMLPSLYVSYRREQNLKSVELQHRAYVETGGYEGVKLANPMACFSLEIPVKGDTVFLTGQAWRAEITARTPETRDLLENMRQLLERYKSGDFTGDGSGEMPGAEGSGGEMPGAGGAGAEGSGGENSGTEASGAEALNGEQLFEQFRNWLSGWQEQPSPLQIRIDIAVREGVEYSGESVKLHRISDRLLIVEAAARDRENIYTNYVAMEDTGEAMIFTCLPAVTPDMAEIRPVVLQSIPMLAAVVLLVVVLFSQMYSRGILRPMYQELEEKNRALQEENRRREIFLRASSHQLKTPLAAALLLLEGVINRVGKYQDADFYLPKVKEQLLSMRRMVEDILSLHHSRDNIRCERLQVLPLLEGRLEGCRVAVLDKGLQVSCSGGNAVVCADEYLLSQIFDNLISNAVRYTPDGGKIEVRISQTEISIENDGVTIPGDILPHIFEPFVSGSHEKGPAGHGLGLYIAAYYAEQMHFSLRVENRAGSVLATLRFCEYEETGVS